MQVSRRGFVGGAVAAAVAGSLREQSELSATDDADGFQLFWGIHRRIHQ